MAILVHADRQATVTPITLGTQAITAKAHDVSLVSTINKEHCAQVHQHWTEKCSLD